VEPEKMCMGSDPENVLLKEAGSAISASTSALKNRTANEGTPLPEQSGLYSSGIGVF
jgi:hypothetical protein